MHDVMDSILDTINQFHLHPHLHKFYVADATFPTDISHLLPEKSEDCWWEALGKP